MKKYLGFFLALLLAFGLASCEQDTIDGTTSSSRHTPAPANVATPTPTYSPTAGSYSLELSFTGSGTGNAIVYAAWIEDESGNNIQNIYVCDREALYVGPTPSPFLTGDALPNWFKKKYPQHPDIDGVTGSSVQGNFSVTRALALGSARRFRVLFDVDHSWNSNAHFSDRPAFTYSTGLIDLDSLSASYPLSVIGWMSNGTGPSSGSLSQYPSPVPSGFSTYTLMTDLSFIQDGSGSLDDMILSIQAVVTQN